MRTLIGAFLLAFLWAIVALPAQAEPKRGDGVSEEAIEWQFNRERVSGMAILEAQEIAGMVPEVR